MQLLNDKLRLINRGANSEIYVYGQQQKVILKVVDVSCKRQLKHLANQHSILTKVQHDGIIRALKYRENVSFNGSVRNVLVLQYANQGSLLDFIKKHKMTIPQIRHLFAQLCQSIEYLHCNYIVHRDLKLDNVLVVSQSSQIKLKLSDFGFASYCIQNNQIKFFNSMKGTKRGYMAPEIHQAINNPQSQYDARKSDIFALGVILFALIFGKLPFEYAQKQNKIFKDITEKNYDSFWNNHQKQISKLEMRQHSMVSDLKQLFEKMVSYNPQQRFNIKEIIQHSWMKGQKKQIKLN